MSLLPSHRLLIAPTRRPHLSPSHPRAAGLAAVALTAVAAPTHGEHGVAVGVQTMPRAKTVDEPILSSHAQHPSHNNPADDRTDDFAPAAQMMSSLHSGQGSKNDDFR